MKTIRLFCLLLMVLGSASASWAQVVTATPTFFRATDQVTITFDATKGNAGLANYTGDVYIYTGVITNLSTTPSDWKHVKNPNGFSTPIAAEKMTALGNRRYSITFVPEDYYPGLKGSGETVRQLAMVFRGTNGTPEGKGAGNTDIFLDVSQTTALQASITAPATSNNNPVLVSGGSVSVTATASAAATLTLTLNGTQVAQQASTTSLSATVAVTQPGINTLVLTANDGTTTVTDQRLLLVQPTITTAALPAGAKKDGVTYLNGGTSAILSLTAPGKQSVYVIGEFNNWQPTAATLMKRTDANDAENGRWWVQLDGLTPGQEYAYQYLVDGSLRIADPYTEKVLDPNNDQYIPAVTYPNLKAYPTGKTTDIVSVLSPGAAEYTWTTTNFQRPARTNMVIYELLVRDFVARHDYKTVTDSLAYLQRLGVNVLELMPVNEFEGNESWGYNPSFYFAPDKYYGTKNDLKKLVDECHRRGIAVVLDMVLNHSFGQSPMVQLYFDGDKPAANSPWFNQDAKHPYNVGYDFNHESAYTKYFTKRVMQFWLQEYHIDGYRFDLAGGFSQVQKTEATYDAVYDPTRIAIWKEYYDYQMSVDNTSYPILESFAANQEGKELADYGMMLWGNLNHAYNQATMGYSDGWDFNWGYYRQRDWNQPNLITYMESHDEERLQFKNAAFGNSSGSYNVKDLATGLKRDEMAAAFFFTIPGPRLMWQFGEVGYDYSINVCADGTTISNDCRLSNKPIRWDYYQQADRRHLFDTYRALIALKKQPLFAALTSFSQELTGQAKAIHLSNGDLSVTVLGNFGVTATTVNPKFQQTGTWYNYLTSTPMNVADANATITLQPGEYFVYTNKPITKPANSVLPVKGAQAMSGLKLLASPNPTGSTATLYYELTSAAPTVSVTVQNMLGATVRTIPVSGRQTSGTHELTLPVANLANGIYFVRLQAGTQQQTTRLVVQH
ncbi:alpha-amylase family glycosyl hydrolase [Hymenobacter defluvii]|uniref:T9SS type A sorting domain-containing protein n=1 Tax=Hymenobacter defluvii TaxID=2054411 RepID=A0ABS3T642_9BACT|nr:alpha-amylase family glycosyl hydrolase [Hymenobacter defluvii]MBO3269120.1 T9SS type A sorting domain-containing protein [Hymenobacter defluvii]